MLIRSALSWGILVGTTGTFNPFSEKRTMRSQQPPPIAQVTTARSGPTGRIRVIELDVRRDRPVFQRQHSLDDTAQPRRPLRVTEVRLHRADVHSPFTEDVTDSVRFNWVACWGSSPVALEIGE